MPIPRLMIPQVRPCLGCRGGGRLAIIVVSVVREGRRGEVEMTNVLSTA